MSYLPPSPTRGRTRGPALLAGGRLPAILLLGPVVIALTV